MKKVLMSLAMCVAMGVAFAEDVKVVSTHLDVTKAVNPEDVVIKNSVTMGGKTYDVNTRLEDIKDGNYTINLQVYKTVNGKEIKDSEHSITTLKNQPVNFGSMNTEQVIDKIHVDENGNEKVLLKSVDLKKEGYLFVLKNLKDKGLVLDYAFSTLSIDKVKTFERGEGLQPMILPSSVSTSVVQSNQPLNLGEKLEVSLKDSGLRYVIVVNKTA